MESSVEDIPAQSLIRRFFAGRSLEHCIDGDRDNILQLRLLAALLVILGHSYGLVGGTVPPTDPLHWVLPSTYTHLVGVMMFFAVSGMLITLSWQRRPSLGRFLRARALRLWPALLVCVFLWAFVLGPLLSSLAPVEYFTMGDKLSSAYSYAFGNASLVKMQWFLPGVFEHTPVKRYVNGALWTIPIEALMYLCVAGVGVLRLFRMPWLASLAIAGVFAWLILWPMQTGTHHWTGIEWLGLNLAGFFGAGSIACLLRRYVPVSTGLMLGFFLLAIAGRTSIHATPLMWLAVGYFVLWFCYVPKFPHLPNDVDLSYGTYLWAFPLQQVLIALGVTNPYVLFATVVPLVLGIAFFSWTWIEKPALRLKDVRWRRLKDAHALS